jgi:hypothetical protein
LKYWLLSEDESWWKVREIKMGLKGEISACSLPSRKQVLLPSTLKLNPEIAVLDEKVYQVVRPTYKSLEVTKPNSN